MNWNSVFELSEKDEDEIFLSEIPVDLLRESLVSQFDYPLGYKKYDYIKSFIDKYDYNKENMIDSDLEDLEETRDEFIGFVMNLFENTLSIGFNDLDNHSIDEQHNIIHLTYLFFIKYIKKNFVNAIKTFIDTRKDEIDEKFELKKDVTTNNFKSEIDNTLDIKILGNLKEVIDYFFMELNEIATVEEFLDLCERDEPRVELDAVREYYANTTLTGNFINKYIDMIDGEFISEIQTKIRNYILKKYPNRKNDYIVKEILDSIDDGLND